MVMALNKPITITSSDGTSFSVKFKGDEFLSWYEDSVGNIITLDEDRAPWYSRFEDEGFTRVEPVNKDTRLKNLEQRYSIESNQSTVNEHRLARMRLLNRDPDSMTTAKSRVRNKTTAPDPADGVARSPALDFNVQTANVRDKNAAGKFEFHPLVIYVTWDSSISQPVLTDDYLTSLFDPTHPDADRGVARWFQSSLPNLCEFHFEGIYRVHLPGTMPNWGNDWNSVAQQLYGPVLTSVAGQGFNFDNYSETISGNKYILSDKLLPIIICHGWEAAYGDPNAVPSVWGYCDMGFTGYTSAGGADLYGLEVYAAYCPAIGTDPIHPLLRGLPCHEMGHHRFMLLDLYALNSSSNGIGEYSIMDYTWGVYPYSNAGAQIMGDTPVITYPELKYAGGWPVLYDAYSLYCIDPTLLEDIDPATFTANTPKSFKATYIKPLLIHPYETPNEVFMIQSRELTTFDSSIQSRWEADNQIVKSWQNARFNTSQNLFGTSAQVATNSGMGLVFHSNLTKTDNDDPSNMMCGMVEFHGGIQNMRQSPQNPTSNMGDWNDPVWTGYRLLLHAYDNSAPSDSNTPFTNTTNPSNRLYNGTLPDLEITHISRDATDPWGYTVLIKYANPPTTPTPPSPPPPPPEPCAECDRPRIYRVQNWSRLKKITT